jgi:hypothetical protein
MKRMAGGKWQEAAGDGRRAGMGRRGARATVVPPGATLLPPPCAASGASGARARPP